MSAIRIVTDSCAHFRHLDFPLYQQIAIVPHCIYLGGLSYREGVDISSEEFLARLSNEDGDPEIVAPSVEEFAAQFIELSEFTHEIICLCVSSRLSRAWQHACEAAVSLLGKLDIAVIDSLSTSTGLGVLVRDAVEFASGDTSLATLRRSIQTMIPRIYAAFFSDSMNYLYRFDRAGAAQAILGDMLGVKPIVALEEGDFAPMEKVGTRAQATERLVEFASEFTDVEAVDVLYGSPERAAEARHLCGRLAVRFPKAEMWRGTFRPNLANLVGADGLGVIICEH